MVTVDDLCYCLLFFVHSYGRTLLGTRSCEPSGFCVDDVLRPVSIISTSPTDYTGFKSYSSNIFFVPKVYTTTYCSSSVSLRDQEILMLYVPDEKSQVLDFPLALRLYSVVSYVIIYFEPHQMGRKRGCIRSFRYREGRDAIATGR